VKGKILRKRSFNYNKEIKFDYQVYLDSLESAPLFHLKGTKNFKSFSPGHRSYSPGGIVQFHPFGNHKLSYTAEFSGIKSHFINRGDLKKFLQVDSSVGDRIKDLAASFKAQDAGSTYKNISEYFRLQNFSYTLKPGQSTLENFLFTSKVGFCEHFSSAAAVLLRLNGIPSRIVTGFHGGLYNPTGGYYQVRGQDAHAWLEYWDGNLWQRGDPTEVVAPNRITYGYEGLLSGNEIPQGMELKDFIGMKRENVFSKLLFAWDSLYTDLNQKFLSYDYSAQRDLINLGKLKRYSSAILLLFCLGLFALFTYFWRRSLKVGDSPLEKAYAEFLGKLRKAGIAKELSEGALSLEERIPRTWSGYHETKEILVLYRDIKYAEELHKLDQFLTKTKGFRPAKINGSGL
ncbi:MAG: transglutaminase-like putative cysteine protease, partial [Bacteriovoracaceae bacterium]